MTKTRIEYDGYDELNDTIRRYCSKCLGIKKEISSGYYIYEQKREIIFDGEFLDVHDEIELEDIGLNYNYNLTITTEA